MLTTIIIGENAMRMVRLVIAGCALLVVAVTPEVCGQTMARIHQMIAVNSVLDRPEVIRELQASLRTSWGGKSEESIAVLVDQRLKEVQERIVTQIDAITITRAGTRITVSLVIPAPLPFGPPGPLPPEIIVIDLDETKTFKKNFDDVRISLRGTILRLLTDSWSFLIQRPGTSGNISSNLESALSFLLSESLGGARGVVLDSVAAALANKLVDRFEELLLSEIQRGSPGFDTEDIAAWADIIASQLPANNILDTMIRNALVHVRTFANNALIQVRSSLVSVVRNMEAVVFSGLGGISVAQGTGDAGGGIEVTFRSDAYIQFRIFTDIAFQPENEQLQPYGMFGWQVGWAPNDYEMNMLATLTVRETIGAGLGLGGSFLFGDNILLGFSLAGAHLSPRLSLANFKSSFESISIRDVTWSAALSLKGASPSSPIFLLGNVVKKGAAPSATFQISYPITDQE